MSQLIKYWGDAEHRSLPNKLSHESLDFVVLNYTKPGSLKFAGTDEVLVACEQRIGLKGSIADGYGEAHFLIASGRGGASKEVTVFGGAYFTYVEASRATEAQEYWDISFKRSKFSWSKLSVYLSWYEMKEDN